MKTPKTSYYANNIIYFDNAKERGREGGREGLKID